MTMKTAKDARIWILRDVVAFSLRKRVATLRVKDIPGDDPTAAQLERVKREMERLADEFTARAERLQGEPEEQPATEPAP